MDTNRCHRAGRCALEARGMAIAVPDELQESVGLGTNRALRTVRGRSADFLKIIARADMPWRAVWRGWRRSMDTNRCHRASGCALEARRTAIALPDELQESEGPCTNRALRALCGSSVSGRLSSCKTSRERMCPGVLSGGVSVARWTQIDAIARADMPWRPVERRLPCQMNCRKMWAWALTGL